MALEQTNVIDSIGIDNQTDRVVLSIIDGFDWQDEETHLCLLQEKINTYLAFLEGGEIYSSYPEAGGRKFEIQVLAQYDFPPTGNEFLAAAKEVIEAAGYEFRSRVLKVES